MKGGERRGEGRRKEEASGGRRRCLEVTHCRGQSKNKAKTKDKAKSVSFFWERDQSKLCTSASSIFLALSPLFTLALIICKNLSYFPRIVERGYERCKREEERFPWSGSGRTKG